MIKRLVGTLYVLLGLAVAFAIVNAHLWRKPLDTQLAKSGGVALGFEVGEFEEQSPPFTFAVVRGARGSHLRLARALEVTKAHDASPVIVLGHDAPDDTLARWRLARVISDQGPGVVHLATPSQLPGAADPLLATTLATPEAFAFRAHGCTFQGGSEPTDWDDSLGLSENAEASLFAFSTNGARPADDVAAAVFLGGPADEHHAKVELVTVAADGALTRNAITVPTAPRPVDAWRAFECSFLPIADSLLALIGVLAAAIVMVAVGTRLALGRGRDMASAAALRPSRAERRAAPRVTRVSTSEIQLVLRG